MCLIYNTKITNQTKNRLKKSTSKSIICYKILKANGYAPIFYMKYHSGWNDSGRTSSLTSCEKYHGVLGGIHVYLHPLTANRVMLSTLFDHIKTVIVIPVRCYLKDFIAGGLDGQAVFTKVFITKKNYKKYINEEK